MFTDFIQSIPSVKESITYIFDYYFGVKLNLSNLSFDDNSGLLIQLTNINIDPSRINHNYLKNINIKLTKGLIEKIELRIGINTFEIKISKISVMVMPVICLDRNEAESKIKNDIDTNEVNKEQNNTNNNKGLISSFIDYYLSKLTISIKEIELIAFNYEMIDKNLTYANPVLLFYIYNIKYDNGKIDENNKDTYIRKNVWENKHFSIEGICIKISKAFTKYKNDEKDLISISENNKKNNINLDKDNNDNILLINTEKGIHIYTNTKNEILADIGDIQLVINLFQLELFKNFIDTYLLYFNNNNSDNNIKNKENIKEEQYNINNNNSDSSVYIQSDNQIMNIKVKLNSFSIVLLEKNQNSTEVKFYEFNKDRMQEHFCYFEGNYFFFILNDLFLEYDNRQKLFSLIISDIIFNYIEYINKIKKEEEIELVSRTGSEYSECNESLIFKSDEIFKPIQDNDNISFAQKEYYSSYDYKYNKNQIILIKDIQLNYNFSNTDKKKVNFDLNSFNVNFHPIFLFKLLKILYENSFLINEVLFYNYEQINIKNKKEDNKDLSDEDEKNKKNENKEYLNLSFLSPDEDENKDKDNEGEETLEREKENKIDSKEITNSDDENKIYSSDLFFEQANNNEPKEAINDKLKNILKTINIEIKIKTIEIRIYSFKCEESFYSIINPFFNEFYYDHIYVMDIKDDFQQKNLKINEISSSDYFNLIIKYISFKSEKNNDGDKLILSFHSIISSFSNNKLLVILSDTFPILYNLDNNKILIDLKINLYLKVKLLPYILTFVNIWKYTLLMYDIFHDRMIYNYNKGKGELQEMNFDKNVLKYFKKNKNKKKAIKINSNITQYDNNDMVRDDNKLCIEVKIKEINIYLDIIVKKIRAIVSLKNIILNSIMSDIKQKFEFSINTIESNELQLFINEIKLDLNIIQKLNINKPNKLSDSIRSKKNKEEANLKSYLIVPEESMEIYIKNIIRIKKRRKLLENYLYKQKNEKIIDINISIKDLQLKPLESILYLNDIYNVIIREEIYNSNNKSRDQSLLNNNKTIKRLSSSSNNSSKSFKNNIIESLMEPEKSQQSKKSIIEKIDSLFTINLNISSIKCIINDDNKIRSIELRIKNINFMKKKLNCEIIEFLIFYEAKDFSEKVIVELGKINNINLNIVEKMKSNISYHIIIDEIYFSFCKDSFMYLENLLDDISNIMSKCFIHVKKTNKIVITKNNEKLLNTYDANDNQSEQESEIFGNNVAKSMCLISTKTKFKLDIDEDYLDNLPNEIEEVKEIIDDLYKSTLKTKKLENKNENDLSLTIKVINIGLYSGNDFESIMDIKTKPVKCGNKEKEKEKENNEINNIDSLNNFNEKLEILQKNIENSQIENLSINENKEKIDNSDIIKKKETDIFELVECNPNRQINAKQRNNYLLFSIDNLNLSIIYEQKNSYEIEFTINDLEIKDNLIESSFKRLLSARKNIGLNDEKKNTPFLSIFVDVSNSQNDISTNNYKDFNLTCEISLTNIQLMLHQNSLIFILNFFLLENASKDNKASPKLYNIEQYHTEPSYIRDSKFIVIEVEEYGEEPNELIEDKNFIYITNFLFREFEVHINYESNNLGFSFQNIYFPIPNLKDFSVFFNRITYKGFVTADKFADYFVEHFLGQLTKYNIVFDVLKSLSWTKPIFNIFGDFFDIFISPFQSYKKNQGFMNGLFKGLKKFFFNLLSKNVYVGEKMIRTLTTFIGVTKNNNIGKNSFYEKYILTDEKKKLYDYFYK